MTEPKGSHKTVYNHFKERWHNSHSIQCIIYTVQHTVTIIRYAKKQENVTYIQEEKKKTNTEIKQVLELAEKIYTENIINMIKDIKEMMVIMNNRWGIQKKWKL